MKKFKKELNSVFEKHGYYFDLNEEEHTTISNEDPYVTKYCLNEDAIELMNTIYILKIIVNLFKI